MREGAGEGLAQYAGSSEGRPSPNPSREREGNSSYSVAWIVATAAITAPIRTDV